jgi:hypothetical protein
MVNAKKKIAMVGVTLIVALTALMAQGELEQITQDENESGTGIVLMREEEKLARDVYLTLYEIYNVPVFSNIAKSEQQHMDSVKWLLEQQGISDPIQDMEIGVFTNPGLAFLYDNLVEQGSASLTQAFMVGALIEDLDIYDLDRLLDGEEDPQIIQVYENLLKGSQNHMNAFYRQIVRDGETYIPSYISLERFEEIVM